MTVSHVSRHVLAGGSSWGSLCEDKLQFSKDLVDHDFRANR